MPEVRDVTHRASYWKTTGIAFAVAGPSLLALSWSLSSHGPRLLIELLLVVSASFLVASLLVAGGGIVCLWRDAREARKVDIFARAVNETPAPNVCSRIAAGILPGETLHPGDLVRVRPLADIAATLDGSGALEGLPFMAEMHAFTGRVLRVHRRVDKINDMRHKTGLRRMHDTVTLSDVRCSGSDHGGCQAECQILWKDKWLEKVASGQPANTPSAPDASGRATDGREEDAGDRVYVCQMTRLWEASRPMSSADIRQDLRPVLSGNVDLAAFLVAIVTRIFNHVQALRGGAGYPFIPQFAVTGSTPTVDLHLAPKEPVVVRSKEEIAGTLVNARNRGLWFDPDMIRFCGRPAVVHKRVDRVIHESTGKMVVMKTPCVMLEEIIATGEFLRLCPQHEYIFWREIWLQRAGQEVPNSPVSR